MSRLWVVGSSGNCKRWYSNTTVLEYLDAMSVHMSLEISTLLVQIMEKNYLLGRCQIESQI